MAGAVWTDDFPSSCEQNGNQCTSLFVGSLFLNKGGQFSVNTLRINTYRYGESSVEIDLLVMGKGL